jgi:arginyl-tRNA synthetase
MEERVAQILQRAVARYLAAHGAEPPGPLHLIRPPREDMGDYASNVAMVLAERVGKKAVDVAREIAGLIEDDEGLLEGEVTVAGRGFLNLRLRMEQWLRLVPGLRARGQAFFREPARTGRKILVEFVSANPTGPLHVGHGRGAVVGDALVRVLRAAGHEASAEYYVNDRGRQVHNLGLSVHFRYHRLFDPGWPEPEGDAWYRGAYVDEIAQALRESRGDSLLDEPPEGAVFREAGIETMMRALRDDLDALGIGFDRWYRESQITDEMMRGTLEDLRARGFVRDNDDGSVAFIMEGTEEDDKERILVKRTGDYTYFATDIPYHVDKIGRGFGSLINVWGADHHGYIPRMKASLRALGYDPDILTVVLVQMVSLSRGGRPVKMSKRAGEFVTLREIVDEVGRDAFRFIFLTRRPDSQFDFDIEAAKQRSLDNPVFHVQYGHARLCSILAKARERNGIDLGVVSDGEAVSLLAEKLVREDERRILKNAMRLGDVIGDAARTLQPHRVATFAMEMSQELQSYYTVSWRVDKDPVLPPESLGRGAGGFPEGWDARRTLARLIWIDGVRIALRTALDILGVTAPERMEKTDEQEGEQA